ncbi:MAG TPA: DUF2244 domain-containing protein [Rhizomicrobium sp.]|nr:DUF2244 domain-containing protein [Rhizomicrobium sp.]
MQAPSTEPVLLDKVLRPSPPMNPRALLIILCVVLAINLGFAVMFMLRGAWPIAPFMGLDVALLAWAFRASQLAARREEHVTLTPSSLRVARKPPRGPVSEFAINPYWVRLEMDEDAWPPKPLRLWSHGKALTLGAFLAPVERVSFGKLLKSALSAARGFQGG